jgi:hypothetical protein
LRGFASRGPILLLLTLLGGCYRYLSTPLDAAPRDQDVRVHLSRVALARVPEEFPTGGTFLTGRIVGVEADSVVLRVPVSRAAGFGLQELRQDVHIPRGEILDIERREVSAARTGLTVAAAAGAASALVLLIIEASGNTDADPGEGPDQLRFPVLSIPVR